jgi:hypothetical protein
MFLLSIETDRDTYRYGYHLGTCEGVARFIAEEYMASRTPKYGKMINTIALLWHDEHTGTQKIKDVLSSDDKWESER